MFQINKKGRYVQNCKEFINLITKSKKKNKSIKKDPKIFKNYFVRFNNKILEKI